MYLHSIFSVYDQTTSVWSNPIPTPTSHTTWPASPAGSGLNFTPYWHDQPSGPLSTSPEAPRSSSASSLPPQPLQPQPASPPPLSSGNLYHQLSMSGGTPEPQYTMTMTHPHPHHHHHYQHQPQPAQHPYDHHSGFSYSSAGIGSTQQHSPASVHSLDNNNSSYSHQGSPLSAGSQRNLDSGGPEVVGPDQHHHVRWSPLTPPHAQAQPQHNLA
jgi:hypothetical protein